jgi:hypothetical protein
MIPKTIANKVLSNLDTAANRIEQLAREGKMDARLASSLVSDLDSFADRFEVSAFGSENLNRRKAALISGDSDEKKYMSTFDNVNKPLVVSADEPYMHETGASARWDSVGTYDVDRSSAVSHRPEFAVVGQSEFSNGGKSVAQPSTPGALKKHKASGPKTWSE